MKKFVAEKVVPTWFNFLGSPFLTITLKFLFDEKEECIWYGFMQYFVSWSYVGTRRVQWNHQSEKKFATGNPLNRSFPKLFMTIPAETRVLWQLTNFCIGKMMITIIRRQIASSSSKGNEKSGAASYSIKRILKLVEYLIACNPLRYLYATSIVFLNAQAAGASDVILCGWWRSRFFI